VVIRGGDGNTTTIRARTTILCTGGYGASPSLFARLHGGAPLYTTASPTSDGSGYAMAEALGARLRNAAYWKPAMAGIEDPPGSGRVVWEDVPLLTPQARKPWEIFVDARGERFVAEDHESVDIRETALAKLPDLAFWVVFDQAIRDAAPPLLPRFDRARLDAAFAGHPSFVMAATLEELARRAAIDTAGLVRTVAAYNSAVAGGADALGRKHMPRAIGEGPFYAIQCRGMVLRTSAGLTIDDDLRLLDGQGEPLPGIRVAGEIIGGGTLSGDGYVGGMSVTPALGFGRWLGETILE
jgi:fumarate reductase flavoprotein subunit